MHGKKILIIGCPGSGKSTFARALREITGLPLYHLDRLYWNPDKTTVPKEVFRQRLREVLEKDCWILDGNYNSTMEPRLKQCDAVFFLDYPVEVCISGIRARFGKPREDLPWVETEQDEDFLRFIRDFREESRPKILALLNKYPEKQVITFRTRQEADAWLRKQAATGAV